jgi:8-oxo-dGTP diphosphatase
MINVTAAIIKRDGRILIAKRSSTSSLPNKWEFPGGKVESGETPEECLQRELREEFEIDATIEDFFGESVYNYDHGSIRLIAYRVHTDEDIVVLNAHDDVQWVPAEQLLEYDLAPADIPIAREIIKHNSCTT